MKNNSIEPAQMLDDLELPLAAARLRELQESPELANYSLIQLLREIIEPQYIDSMNARFKKNLKQSSLKNKSGKAENL